jgi:hypothetical protein
MREIPNIHPFVEASVMLYAFDAPVFPIDDEMLSYLAEEDAVEEGTSLTDAQKFIEHQLKGDELYDLFAAMRVACFEDAKRKKKK